MLADLVRKRDAKVAVRPRAPLDVRVAVNVTSQDLPLKLFRAAHTVPHVRGAHQKPTAHRASQHSTDRSIEQPQLAGTVSCSMSPNASYYTISIP